MFYPLTASPFKKDEQYIEIVPCASLRSYIRCFWGSQIGSCGVKGLVIPDVCADLIFRIWQDKITVSFVGVSDEPFMGNYTYEKCCTFGIRFYAWTVGLFSDASLMMTKNASFEASFLFGTMIDTLCKAFLKAKSMEERKQAAETILWEQLCLKRKQVIVLEAVQEILAAKGAMPIDEVASVIHVGTRQLERIFQEGVGISPKQLSSLIRYQVLWQEILENRQISLVQKSIDLGFSDQAHMCREFKKYHGMNIHEARAYAYQDVAFFQDNATMKG